MKKFKFGSRVLALVLTFVMVLSLVPASIFAGTKGDIATESSAGKTGIDEGTLNAKGTINWPIKVYDYLADGMLFEFAQNGSTSPLNTSPYGAVDASTHGGQYVLGQPMPCGAHNVYSSYYYVTDYTSRAAYLSNAYKRYTSSGYGTKYKPNKMDAVDYVSPRYLRLKFNSASGNQNYCVSDFEKDNGMSKVYGSTIRYMVMVYRSQGIPESVTNKVSPLSILIHHTNESSPWNRLEYTTWKNSADWTYVVIDLQSLTGGSHKFRATDYTDILCITPNLSESTDYLDLSHVAYFSTKAAANTFGQQCLAFNNEPGEYISGYYEYWNAANNTAFGMLFASDGAPWGGGGSVGGSPSTATGLGYESTGYYTHRIGYWIPSLASDSTKATNNNSNRKTGKDSNGRYNGTGDKQGENGIYFIESSSYAKNSGTDTYDMSKLDFGDYSLLTQAARGVWTAGLLQGTLGADGIPQYKQETVEYIADLLSKTLVIPQYADSDITKGYANYNYVAGVKNGEQYGYTDVNGTEVANDLAQALRNCLGITFTAGDDKGSTPAMGTYADTLAKSDMLKGAFKVVSGQSENSSGQKVNQITTCMDAAYYLLHNLFVSNSYNQEQDDFRYLTLSSATLDNGEEAFVFDGGFSNGASLADLEANKLTQEDYKKASQNAVEYNGYNLGGDGTISLNKVDEKDLYWYNSGTTTTRFPFLPVVDAEGVYAGQTDSYYFAEDGKRNYSTDHSTYYGRNYNYVLASNGEFVYTEEDNLFFEFEGDDDVYLFINGELVLDLGGGHSISSCSFNVNDYVAWAREVLKNPSDYTEAEIARAEALDLENGEIASFDFYYMERHGFGANMRIVTNMHITDPDLRVEKTAYQGGKQIEYGGIVDADDPIEYNFKLNNIGNKKLYNLTFNDEAIGVSLTPDNGLAVKGDDTDTELDDINGYLVTDARGDRLDAQDLTAIVTGYQQVDSGGDYIQDGHDYTKVEDGTGTHIYHENIVVNFANNDELKNFLKTLQSSKTDSETVDEELTQKGSGLWVDASVTFKGIYYTMTDDQEIAGVFENTVNTTATTKSNTDDPGNETLRSNARHRVYVTAIPSYYQWAGHDLFILEQAVLDDATAEAGNEGSMLHDYKSFFDEVNGDLSKINISFADRMGNKLTDDDYEFVDFYKDASGNAGFKTNYDTPDIYEFYLLMYLNDKSGVVKDMDLGDYAIVRVLVIVADVEDSQYVLDYGLTTENLDNNGELFKNDELYGSMSGTMAKLMGFSATEPSYLNVKDGGTDYNRIDFTTYDGGSKIQVEDGYYTANLAIPEEGRTINFDEFSGMYTMTDTGTTLIHADAPYAWDNLYLYYWYDDGRDNVWPGTPMKMTSHGNFELAIPSNVPHIIISNGTNQTVDINLNPGYEAWVDIDGTLNDDSKLNSSITYKTADGILHVAVPENWGDVYLYCWDMFEHEVASWPGTKIETKDEDGYYTLTIPGDITNLIINNGSEGVVDARKQTVNQTISAGKESWITVANAPTEDSAGQNPEYYHATITTTQEKIVMHATVPDNWENVYLYYWHSNGSSTGFSWPGKQMALDAETGIYYLEVPADIENVIVSDGNFRQTENIDVTPGIETWINVNSLTSNATVEVTVPDDWGTAYFYYFNAENGKPVAGTWPGTAGTSLGNNTYSSQVPPYATHVIVTTENGNRQTADLALSADTLNSFVVSSDNSVNVSKTRVRVKVPDDWTGPVKIYYWKDSRDNGWSGEEITTVENGYYVYTIPDWPVNAIINNGEGTQTVNLDVIPYATNTIELTEKGDNGQYKADVTVTDVSVQIVTPATKTTATVSYGEDAEAEGFTFTPTNFMDSVYSLWMAITVHETDINTAAKPTALGSAINIGKEVQMFKKITVLPASVVYYEDDFAGITYNDNTGNVIKHYGNGSGSLTQSIDQNQQYGNDSTYQGSENDEMTGGSLTDVYINDAKEFATFNFTGTGFEIVGHCYADDSGTLMVKIFDADNNLVKQIPVITEFDNGGDGGTENIVSVPLVRVNGLDYAAYKVVLSGVPVFDFSNWTDKTQAPPVDTSYLCIDGIRVYQPLSGSDQDSDGNVVSGPGVHDAYLDTESGATFAELRNLIADRQVFAIKYDDTDGLSVSGGTNTWIENRNKVLPGNHNTIWENNTVNSVNDYLLAGPNNEVYMIESTDKEKSAIAFYVTETAKENADMQIAVRALDYDSYTGSENTGQLYAEIEYGAVNANGELVWRNLTTTVSSTEQYFRIPYTECPYDEANNRYQVVLRVADTTPTGMASYTSLKYKGLELLELNETEVPDVVYGDEISNVLLDSNGNTLDSSKFVAFINLVDQMTAVSEIKLSSSGNGTTTVITGTDTSAMGALYDTFTANTSDFAITEDSKIYIVVESEENEPDKDVQDTAQLVQRQFAADGYDMQIVWGLEQYTEKGDILVYVDSSYSYGDEGYKLEVTDRAKLYSRNSDGMLYGLNTLQKHFRAAGKNAIKGFTLIDAPDTKERTVHLDVARKYMSPEGVKNYIAQLSWQGYNSIELHMSEDGGMRMDFWGDKALNEVDDMTGNDFTWICGDNPPDWVWSDFREVNGKYLTTEEIIDICETAKEYHIDIIPSFDTPAHVGYMTELYYNTVKNNSNSPIRNFTYNGTSYTLPEQINYRDYTDADSTRYDFSVLDLSNTAVRNFAYAMYNDIAAFFAHYAGSTKFNIGADEVGLTSSDRWNYNTHFVNYVNDVNDVLKSHGYTARMYNDFLYNTNYSTITSGIDTDIEVVYWLPATSSRTHLRSASFYANQGRTVYSGVNFWTYYVLRIAPDNYNNAGVQTNAGTQDARDPNCKWWEFYRNQEDYIYNEWNASQMGAYTDTNMGSAYNYSGDKLGGAYFMIWNDFAGLNSEVEVWNGCYNEYGTYNKTTGAHTGNGQYYSMMERMWSNAIKQWNSDINSSLTFAKYETLRDKQGFFPGYVATSSSQSYMNAMNLPEEKDIEAAYRTYHTVTFKNYDGTVIDTQEVKEGYSATAPAATPTKPATVWYTYTFSGWDTDFTNITGDTTVTAQFTQTATTAGTVAYLELKSSGGSNINMSVNGGTSRPVGTEYVNAGIDFGKYITVSAVTNNDNEFIGWVNAKTGQLVSKNATYSFYTSGNDVLVAMYMVDVQGKSLVTFRNNKTNQIVDIQYYGADDIIDYPAVADYLGYEFAGWDLSAAEVAEKLAAGENFTLTTKWNVKNVSFKVVVNDGAIISSAGTGADNMVVAYKGTVVKAKDAETGTRFAYWMDEQGRIVSYDSEYKFYPHKNTELTAVYVDENATVDYSIISTVDIDATTLGDANTVFFSWDSSHTDYDVLNRGVLLVKKEHYLESTFGVGTIDKNVLQFVPAIKNSNTGSYSITIPEVQLGDTWVAKSFVQYRDAEGVLRVVYSDVCEVTKA